MVALLLLTTACSVATQPTPSSVIATTATTTPAASTTMVRQCRAEPDQLIFTGTDSIALSLALTRATLNCAEEVVVASGSDADLLVAGELAASRGAPLLIFDPAAPDMNSELLRLAPASVVVVGDSLPAGIPTGTTTTSLTVSEADAASNQQPRPTDPGVIWLADATRPDLMAPVIAIAGVRGEQVVRADPHNMLGDRDLLEAVRGAETDEMFVAGDFDPLIIDWQAAALLSAPELPGGGLKLFPGRRVLALYGNPTTSALGVLGEQGPEEAVARAREISVGYDGDGTPILLGFEMIATVASAGPSADGNYSEEMSLDTLRPWIDVAAANDVYVILDLQPGRTDFLTQAQAYEEFLVLPHVGLALDPEWRLEPDQVHLRQIGSVDSDEINGVSEWLAGLVRDHTLPQKFFLLHQFRLDMIDNRDQIQTHPELATVIQMDGQGPLGTKYDTWDALTAGTENLGVFWGWKNFYDEDTPRGGATPAEVLELEPVPVYVSYQ